MEVVVRFAPSPTGPLHIGGVRTALYNYLLYKKHGGRFILRIEDTDQNRFVPGAEEFVLESLAWMGIDFSEGPGKEGESGPYRQSERHKAGLYTPFAEQLVRGGHAYLAFDTPEELDAMREKMTAEGHKSGAPYSFATRHQMKNSLSLTPEEVQARIDAGEPYVIRMLMPRKEEIRFYDEVHQWVMFHSSQLDDKVLVKSDGMPTYHLANVVDDHLMGVTHVIRGEEWLSSTPLHVMLYRAFGWERSIPAFVHLPLILNPNGEGKMSKRMGDKLGFSVFPISWTDPETGNHSFGFREAGYLPEAMMNFLALLGWNPGHDEEIMDAARMAEAFSLEKVNNSGTKFDIDKLKWFNQTYIRAAKPAHLLPVVKPLVAAAGFAVPEDAFLEEAIHLMQERVTLLPDFVQDCRFFFEAPTAYDAKMSSKFGPKEREVMEGLATKWENLTTWDLDSLHATFEAIKLEMEVGNGKVLAPLRLALTGVPAGPGAFEIAALIGKNESVARIRAALKNIPLGTA